MGIKEYNPLKTKYGNPWLLLAALVLVVIGGVFVIGPVLAAVIALAMTGKNIFNMPGFMAHPESHPELKSVMMMIQGVVSLGAFIIAPLIFYYTAVKGKISGFISRVPLKLTPALYTLIIVLSFMVVNSVVIKWNANITFPDWMSSFEHFAKNMEDQLKGMMDYLTNMDSFGYFLLSIVVIAIVPAIGEELVFRGMLQNLFRLTLKNPHLAIWLSGFIFGAIHMQFYGMVPRMLLGVLFGYLYWWSGNLLVPMLAHFLNNGLSIVMMYIHQTGISKIDVDTDDAFPLPYIIGFSIVTIYFLFSFYNYYKNQTVHGELANSVQDRQDGEG